MKIIRAWVPFVALAALAACGDDDTTDITSSQANVRFVNAMIGASSSLGLTANGTPVGSGVAFANQSTRCTRVEPGTRTFAFGPVATTGTGISTSLRTFNRNLTAGGSYTVVALGTPESPSYVFLDNKPATAATGSNANVRFVNATGTGFLDVYATTGATLGAATATGLGGSTAASEYASVASSTSSAVFTTSGTTTPVFTAANLGLSSRGNFTVVLFPTATGTGHQALVINDAC